MKKNTLNAKQPVGWEKPVAAPTLHSYKNKIFNIKLKPVFQTIVENQYILR